MLYYICIYKIINNLYCLWFNISVCTGQHPCILSSVHEESEAFQAGLRHGDRLLKVNGVPVDKGTYLLCEVPFLLFV